MRKLLPVGVFALLLVLSPPALAAGASTARTAATPARAATRPNWGSYRAPKGKMPLSSAAQLGLSGLDTGNDDQGVLDSFPGTGVPQLPSGFAPNVIVNQDRSAQPHDETSVAINPKNPKNVLVGANDYSLGFGSSGTYASFDGGATWYGSLQPFPQVKYCPGSMIAGDTTCTTPLETNPEVMDGGGDPSVVFDHDGVAYYAEINFHRIGCISGVFVFRSYNGGQTWSRPLFGPTSPGDSKVNGDGVVAINPNDNDCSTFYDKEMITAGPRPAGATLVPGTDTAHLSSDRLYVSYSGFHQVNPIQVQPFTGPTIVEDLDAATFVAYSDDQGRHWSVTNNGIPLATAGFVGGSSASYCSGWTLGYVAPPGTNTCADSQGSDVAVDPRNGKVYASFNNSDNNDSACNAGGTPAMTQILVVASSDGGATWSAPQRAACVNPNLATPDATACPASGTTPGISNACFRVPVVSTGSNVTLNPVDGSVHVVWMSNSGGTNFSGSSGLTDVDVFTSASTDGGQTFAKPVKVNPDGTKTDQFFPWGAYGPDGVFYVAYLDRSYDPAGKLIGESLARSTDNGKTWSRQELSTGLFDGNKSFRAGAFMGDYTGVAASTLGAYAAWPDTRRAGTFKAGDNPLEEWSDIAGAATYPLTTPTASVIPGLPNTALGGGPALVIYGLGLAGGVALGFRLFRRRRLPARQGAPLG